MMDETYTLLMAWLHRLEVQVAALSDEVKDLREALAEADSAGWLGGTD